MESRLPTPEELEEAQEWRHLRAQYPHNNLTITRTQPTGRYYGGSDHRLHTRECATRRGARLALQVLLEARTPIELALLHGTGLTTFPTTPVQTTPFPTDGIYCEHWPVDTCLTFVQPQWLVQGHLIQHGYITSPRGTGFTHLGWVAADPLDTWWFWPMSATSDRTARGISQILGRWYGTVRHDATHREYGVSAQGECWWRPISAV